MADMKEIIDHLKSGYPIYIKPYKENKVWGVRGIGEYWYGAESGIKSSTASFNGQTFPMDMVLNFSMDDFIGEKVVKTFGPSIPLVKILTPKARLSVQFHDKKNELWIVTAIDKKHSGQRPSIIIGFNKDMISRYGEKVKARYEAALKVFGDNLNILTDELLRNGYEYLLKEEKDVIKAAERLDDNEEIKLHLQKLIEAKEHMEGFYHYLDVNEGDIIPVSCGTLHALGPGIEVVEPQISGPTQSLEDGSTYPIRYFFPGYERNGGNKKLDVERVNEMNCKPFAPEDGLLISEGEGVRVYRLPGGFEDKGLEVNIIELKKDNTIKTEYSKSYHLFTVLKGSSSIITNNEHYVIPKASPNNEMVFLPQCSKNYFITAKEDTKIMDVFTPIY